METNKIRKPLTSLRSWVGRREESTNAHQKNKISPEEKKKTCNLLSVRTGNGHERNQRTSPPLFTRLTEHHNALRAWCTQMPAW